MNQIQLVTKHCLYKHARIFIIYILSIYMCVCVCLHIKEFRGMKVLSCFSRVWLFATPWTVARQAPLSMEFYRWKYWSGLPFPSPADLPDPGIESVSLKSPALQADSLPLASPVNEWIYNIKCTATHTHTHACTRSLTQLVTEVKPPTRAIAATRQSSPIQSIRPQKTNTLLPT